MTFHLIAWSQYNSTIFEFVGALPLSEVSRTIMRENWDEGCGGLHEHGREEGVESRGAEAGRDSLSQFRTSQESWPDSITRAQKRGELGRVEGTFLRRRKLAVGSAPVLGVASREAAAVGTGSAKDPSCFRVPLLSAVDVVLVEARRVRPCCGRLRRWARA